MATTRDLLKRLTAGGGMGPEQMFVDPSVVNFLTPQQEKARNPVVPGTGERQLQPITMPGERVLEEMSPSSPGSVGGGSLPGMGVVSSPAPAPGSSVVSSLFGDKPINLGKIGGAVAKAASLFSTPAALANSAINAHNMGLTTDARVAMGLPPLTFGQKAGGLLGFNEYGKGSTAQNMLNMLAVTTGVRAGNFNGGNAPAVGPTIDALGGVLSLPAGGGYDGATFNGTPVSAAAAEAIAAGDQAAALAALSQMSGNLTPAQMLAISGGATAAPAAGGNDAGWHSGSGIPGDFAYSAPSMGGYDFGFSGGPGY